MNPLERLLDIDVRLNEGTISVDEACAKLFTGPKSWHRRYSLGLPFFQEFSKSLESVAHHLISNALCRRSRSRIP